MMRPVVRILTLAVLVLAFAAPARADELADARAFIGGQVELIKKGDVAALKAGFTRRLHDSITAENVKAAQKEAGKTTIEELVHSVIPGPGKIKIKMKNGRTLTTLLQVDGKWLADSIWFK